MSGHHWKMSEHQPGINHQAHYAADDRTEHNGPECGVCGFVFCEHCDYDICKKQGSSGSAWNFECPGAPPAGKKWIWELAYGFPKEMPSGYEEVNGDHSSLAE